jgi:Zn finger protein HypA/HybF involved in hydrogenase expression
MTITCKKCNTTTKKHNYMHVTICPKCGSTMKHDCKDNVIMVYTSR